MRPERHQVVHQVVPARDRGEYLANARGFLRLADLFIAEIDGALFAHGGLDSRASIVPSPIGRRAPEELWRRGALGRRGALWRGRWRGRLSAALEIASPVDRVPGAELV